MSTVPFGDVFEAIARIRAAALVVTDRNVLIDTELDGDTPGLALVLTTPSGTVRRMEPVTFEAAVAMADLLETLASVKARA